MVDYQRIIKDCFWDTNITENDICKILKGNDQREKNYLFEKILLNSTKLFNDLSLFSKSELKYFIENYKIPKFNYQFIFRRKNLAEVFFLDKPLLIDELKWIV
jgi:hypothetical protein